jgi:hypothetical protein
MPKFEKKGQEPERLPTSGEIQASGVTHNGKVALIAPPGVTAASGCEFDGRLCWAPPEIVDQLITMHGFEKPRG